MVAKTQEQTGNVLAGRKLYIPQMAYAGARTLAATFRSIGIDAAVAPDSDAETLDLGGLYSSGEECLPHKVTLGDFLKVCNQPDFEPSKTAFFMATAHGPCRFGQYAPYLRQVMRDMGYGDVLVFSPTSANGYNEIGESATKVLIDMWLGLVAGDVAQKFLLKTRPYERNAGDSDQAFQNSIAVFERVLEQPGLASNKRLAAMVEAVERMRDRFRAVPADYEKGRPLIGLVGEIFCRLNTFSNEDLARRVEQLGGECWISDIAEWVWYVNWYVDDKTAREKGRLNADYLKHKLKTHWQHKYEKALLAPVANDLKGYEEPHNIRKEVLDPSEPYLPTRGSIGEMVLSIGKSIYLYRKGVDGIIDISPFTCMNGIICEGVYPSVSAACEDVPMRTFYFDGTNSDIERDLEIFLDLARSYQKRKTHQRVYPDYFV